MFCHSMLIWMFFQLIISMLNLVSFKSYNSKFSLSLSYAGLACNFFVVLSIVLSNDGVSLGVLSFDLMPQSWNPKNTKQVSFRFSTLLSIKLWLPSTFSIVLWPLSQLTKTTRLLKSFSNKSKNWKFISGESQTAKADNSEVKANCLMTVFSFLIRQIVDFYSDLENIDKEHKSNQSNFT